MTDNVNGKQEITEKKEESAQPQEDTGTKGAQSCSDIATEQEQLANSTNVDCGVSQDGESGEPSEGKANGKCLQKDKLSCKIPWLVGLSLLFVLIIVIGLFERVVIIHVNNPKDWANNCVVTVLRICLYLSSFIISILSGCIVYQKGKENRQKQQSMIAKIKWQENCLDIIYKNFGNSKKNQ